MLLDIHEPGQTPLPHEDEKIAIGIDLGTTNTVVALSDSGKAEVLRDENGAGLIPSVVAYSRKGAVTVGEAARNLIGEEGFEVISSIKRLMGRSGVEVEKISGNLRHSLVETGEGMAQLDVWGRKVSPVEISAEILKNAKQRAEVALGHKIAQAVITVPAYFDDAARAATRDAANVAGLEVLRMIAEPTAAALAYGLDKGAEGLYAVYDLGGGTFDFSLLRMEKGVFQVLATGGNTRLGGDDFDREIAERIVARCQMPDASKNTGNWELGTGNSLTPHEVNQLLKHARIIKEQLTSSEQVKHEFALCYRKISAEVTKLEFEALINKYVTETISIIESVLADAGVSKADVKGVVMVGGSTRVPLVQKIIGEFFGKTPLADVDPDEVVAYGAAIQAEGLTKGSDNLLLDVTPLSLGLETMGGIAEKIISRNTPIPVSISQEFTTYADNQNGMTIHVVQGEREMVSDCRSLARFELLGIPPLPAGVARIKVIFTVDADGLLSVTAKEETTGNVQRVEVRPTYGLETAQIEEMLRNSCQYANDDMEARMLAETKVEAERLLLALQGAITRHKGMLEAGEETAINKAMREVKVAIGSGDRDLISYKSGLLEQCLQNFAAKIMDEAVLKVLKGSHIENMEGSLDNNKAA